MTSRDFDYFLYTLYFELYFLGLKLYTGEPYYMLSFYLPIRVYEIENDPYL